LKKADDQAVPQPEGIAQRGWVELDVTLKRTGIDVYGAVSGFKEKIKITLKGGCKTCKQESPKALSVPWEIIRESAWGAFRPQKAS